MAAAPAMTSMASKMTGYSFASRGETPAWSATECIPE